MSAELRPLLVSPYANIGGAQLVLLRIVDAMGDDLEPLGLVMNEGPLAGLLEQRGVPTHVERLPGKRSLLRFRAAAARAAERLRSQQVSLIHANGVKAAVFGMFLSRRLGVPLVWMKHDHVTGRRVTRAVASRCDAVICVSEAMASELSGRLSDRVAVVYPGAEPVDSVTPVGEELLITCVGRLDPAKGFAELLRATALLRQRGLDARIVVAGPVDRVHPEHAAELEQLVTELGLDEHAQVGWVDDLTGVYTRARVTAIASPPRPSGRPGEGAPIVLLEAMAHGRPVVAPREGGIAEIVGDAGTLVDDLTPEGLAEALERYLRDRELAVEHGTRGRRRVEESFTLARTVERLGDVYRRVAAGEPLS
jgi:glycosyltransferase involved in cell wall biosynthesis